MKRRWVPYIKEANLKKEAALPLLALAAGKIGAGIAAAKAAGAAVAATKTGAALIGAGKVAGTAINVAATGLMVKDIADSVSKNKNNQQQEEAVANADQTQSLNTSAPPSNTSTPPGN